jgi:hypothetical protein
MSEEEVEIVSRLTKILAASRGLLIAALIVVVLSSVTGIFTVLDRIDKSNARLLDCIAPYGLCYIQKAAALESNNIVHINAVAAYCESIPENRTVREIEDCMVKELAK